MFTSGQIFAATLYERNRFRGRESSLRHQTGRGDPSKVERVQGETLLPSRQHPTSRMSVTRALRAFPSCLRCHLANDHRFEFAHQIVQETFRSCSSSYRRGKVARLEIGWLEGRKERRDGSLPPLIPFDSRNESLEINSIVRQIYRIRREYSSALTRDLCQLGGDEVVSETVRDS